MRGQITIGASGDIYGVVTTHILLFWELECRPTEAAKWWEPMPIDSVSLNEAVAVSLSRSEFDTQSAIVSMAEALIKRAQEEARVDTGIDFQDASLYRAQTERGKLLNFKERNADTTSVLAKARAALDWVETHLTSMKTNLQNITSGSTTEERAAAAADYDTLIGDINSEISGATQLVNNIPTNLVGRPSIPSPLPPPPPGGVSPGPALASGGCEGQRGGRQSRRPPQPGTGRGGRRAAEGRGRRGQICEDEFLFFPNDEIIGWYH